MMLVLQRGPEQGFLIGENIRVIVLEVRESYVGLGIEAPGDVPVVREELLPAPPPMPKKKRRRDRR